MRVVVYAVLMLLAAASATAGAFAVLMLTTP